MTLTNLVHRLFEGLEKLEDEREYPNLEGLAGILPENANVAEDHVDHLEDKHR